jgi:UDP-N-acetylmuramoyl-L-alanyl-D-glutamate--2,6-diaminopimelate ligase
LNLKELIKRFPDFTLNDKSDQDFELAYIQTDSRKIQANDIFALNPSESTIGYFRNAAEKGSKIAMIPIDSDPRFTPELTELFPCILFVPNSVDRWVGRVASEILGNPSQKIKVIAVTGTNGKTSVTHILHFLALASGFKSGLIGTIYAKFGEVTRETGFTTPDAPQLQLLFKEMSDANIEYVFLESSSHGLKLGRMEGVCLKAAVFTNLTQDHLDFHPDMDDYLQSKFHLFELLAESKSGIGMLCYGPPGTQEMFYKIRNHPGLEAVQRIGMNSNLDFNLSRTNLAISGSQFLFSIPNSGTQSEYMINTNLLGEFNIWNLGLSLATWYRLHPESLEKLIPKLNSIPRIPGRFDLYYSPDKKRLGIVDYAHTPDALLNILQSCRGLNPSKLFVLFGCGGDRDRTKRPKMAKIAEENSDFVIITSDNPRNEDPEKILNDIESGFSPKFSNFIRVEDRKAAIKFAVEMLPENGILAVCGKGHENYQIVGKEKFYFDDGEILEETLQFWNTGR